MSAQLIELLLFAGIAFVLISRLISMLGSTDEDDPARTHSIFGEPANMKDVTNYQHGSNSLKSKLLKKATLNYSDMIVEENFASIEETLENVKEVLPNFTLEKFIKGAKAVFKIIIQALVKNDQKSLMQLVDKRYQEQILGLSARYKHLAKDINDITAKVSEVLTFGNNIIIKVLYVSGKNSIIKEEWTFQKSLLNSGPDWYLTNIEIVE